MTRGDSVQRPLTSGLGGGRPVSFCVSSDQNFLDMCLHEKGKAMVVEKVGGGRTQWLAGHMARPADLHLVSYHLSQVGGAPLWVYKCPPTGESRHTHTPHFGDSTCKDLFLSVVARRSLVGRVARL
jgi:hypothetical protein